MDEVREEASSLRGTKLQSGFVLNKSMAERIVRETDNSLLRETTKEYVLYEGKYTDYIVAVNADNLVEYAIVPRQESSAPETELYKETLLEMREDRIKLRKVNRAIMAIVALIFVGGVALIFCI